MEKSLYQSKIVEVVHFDENNVKATRPNGSMSEERSALVLLRYLAKQEALCPGYTG